MLTPTCSVIGCVMTVVEMGGKDAGSSETSNTGAAMVPSSCGPWFKKKKKKIPLFIWNLVKSNVLVKDHIKLFKKKKKKPNKELEVCLMDCLVVGWLTCELLFLIATVFTQRNFAWWRCSSRVLEAALRPLYSVCKWDLWSNTWNWSKDTTSVCQKHYAGEQLLQRRDFWRLEILRCNSSACHTTDGSSGLV